MEMLMSPTSIPGVRIRPPAKPPGKKLPTRKIRKIQVGSNKPIKRKPGAKRLRKSPK